MIAGASRIVILFAMAVSPFVAAQRASLSQVDMVSSGSEEGTRPFRESRRFVSALGMPTETQPVWRS